MAQLALVRLDGGVTTESRSGEPQEAPPRDDRAGSVPTLRDVARAAFVGVSTASAALRNKPGVAAETRERVLAVARELGYTPNEMARALRGSERTLIGLFVEPQLFDGVRESSRLFIHRLLWEFNDELSRAGISVQSLAVDPVQTSIRPTVLVVVGQDSSGAEWVDAVRSAPIIRVGGSHQHANEVANLQHDHEAYARELVAHLLSQGASRLAVFHQARPVYYSDIATQAVVATCMSAGLDVRTYTGAVSAADVRKIADTAIADGCDAVFSMLPFPGVILAAVTSAGLSCPGDVLVVLRTEGTVEAETNPQVSVVSMKAFESGHLLVDVTNQVLEGQIPGEVTLPYELIVRESSLRSGIDA